MADESGAVQLQFELEPKVCAGDLNPTGGRPSSLDQAVLANVAPWAWIFRIAWMMWSMSVRSANSRLWDRPTVVAQTCRLPFNSWKLSRYSFNRAALNSRLKPRELIASSSKPSLYCS